MKKLSVVLLTNIPAPYRVPVFELLAQTRPWDFHVVYCSASEPDRDWQLERGGYAQHYLKSKMLTLRGKYVHFNPDLWSTLNTLRPDVLITTGFNPSHLIAFAYARMHGARHIAMTDGTFESEKALTRVHRVLRRWVYARTEAFIGASEGSSALYRSYGVSPHKIFQSHLCANNTLFEARSRGVSKEYDLLFCGRIVAEKSPMFALDVARETARLLRRRVSLAVVGAGVAEPEMRAAAQAMRDQIDVAFLGFAQQEELPARYGASRVLLFPSRGDTWGVVANEACACGVPVVVSPMAGVAGELIRDGQTGFVLDLSVSVWAKACVCLLTDGRLYEEMSTQCRRAVQAYSYEQAMQGLRSAIECAVP